jgi:hypothetical protein
MEVFSLNLPQKVESFNNELLVFYCLTLGSNKHHGNPQNHKLKQNKVPWDTT